MSTPDLHDDMHEWFLVIDETIEDPGGQPEEEPALSGAPAILLQQLRMLIPTWRALGLGDDDTFAGYLDGRLWVGIDLFDRQGGASIGFVRLDITDSSWTGSWVSSSRGTQPNLEDAYPKEQTGGPIVDVRAGADEAVQWLVAQLRRPVRRHIWRDRGRVVAESWRLEDSGRELAVSGSVLLRGSRPPDAALTVRQPPPR